MVRRYKVELSADGAGRVSVRVPAIPEIHSEAHTKEQALQFVQTVVTAHLKSLQASGGKIPDSDTNAIVVEI